MAKLRIGFVGAGGHQMSHVGVIADALRDEAEIVAFCDVKPGLAESRTAQYGGEAFLSADEMYDKAKPDAVFITLPPFAHGPEFGAIERGIPFLVEKPVNLDLAQAEEIARAAAAKGVVAGAAYMNRYRKGIQEAKRLFDDDAPVLTMGGWAGGSPGIATEGIGVWWVQKDKSGGQLVEQVTHTIDLVRWFCGEPVEVAAFGATGFNTGNPNYTIDDAVAVSVKFDRGGVANLYSCCASNAMGGVTLDVMAKQCAARFTGWGHDATIYQVGKDPVTHAGEGNIFELEDRAFLEAARTGDASKLLSSFADGVETLRLSLAANAAIETGAVQKLR